MGTSFKESSEFIPHTITKRKLLKSVDQEVATRRSRLRYDLRLLGAARFRSRGPIDGASRTPIRVLSGVHADRKFHPPVRSIPKRGTDKTRPESLVSPLSCHAQRCARYCRRWLSPHHESHEPKARIDSARTEMDKEKAPPKRGFMTGYANNTGGYSGVRYASDHCDPSITRPSRLLITNK